MKRDLGPIYSVTGVTGTAAILRYFTDDEFGISRTRYALVADLDALTIDELTQLLFRLLQTVLKEDPNKKG